MSQCECHFLLLHVEFQFSVFFRPILLKQFVVVRIDDLLLEIHPDALVVVAVVSAAGNGAMLANRARTGGMLEVLAIAIGALRNEIRRAQIPFDNAFVNVLHGQREGQLATGSFAEMHAILAVNFDVILLKSILIPL